MAFPNASVVVLDDGNRANEDPLSNGGSWTTMAGLSAPAIVSNKISTNQGATYVGSSWTRTSYLNVDVTMDIDTLNASSEFYLYARSQAATDAANKYVLLIINNGATWRLLKKIGGANTTITESFPSLASGAGRKIGLHVLGSALEAWYFDGSTWSLVLSGTDSAIGGSGFIGFLAGVNTFITDNFSAGVPVGSGDDPPIGILGRGAGW